MARAVFGAAAALAAALSLTSLSALAQVLEPNGAQAPNLPSTNGETSIQDYFDAEGENIAAAVARPVGSW